MRSILKENLIKNVLLIIIFIILYFPINSYLMNSIIATDKSLAGDVIIVISLVSVIACFGNFAFSYEKINQVSAPQRLLGHFTTGILMLVIGITLIFLALLVSIIVEHSIIIDLTLVILYLGCVGYDFWDLFRIGS